VLVVMALACLAFWVAVPVGVLWGLGELTDDGTEHFLLALIGVPAAMVAVAPLLIWLNGLYLRVTGVYERLEEDEDEAGWQRRLRGPLEPMLVTCFVIELVALFVWFFFFAENPSISVL
jgi:ABC-type dipeptide/oligopeptide/nickel transport system permease component